MVGTIARGLSRTALCSGETKNRITWGGNVGITLIDGYERRHLCTTQRSRAQRVLRKFCTRVSLRGRYSSSYPHRDLYRMSRNTRAEHPNTRTTRIHNPHWLACRPASPTFDQSVANRLVGGGVRIFGYSAIVVFRIFKFTDTAEY